MPKKNQRLRIMVSSTVYGVEELLDQVYALLSGFGYEVWMSHKGTVPINPNQTALDSCLLAVEKCDLFVSIITSQYGSGVLSGRLSITHQELLKAIAFNKPRWILADDHVVFARSLFRKLGGRDQQERENLLARLGFGDEKALSEMRKREAHVIDDFRVIDMYETAIRYDLKVYQDRKGNWVQKFQESGDVKLFATAQFSRYRDVQNFLEEQFSDKSEVETKATGRTSS